MNEEISLNTTETDPQVLIQSFFHAFPDYAGEDRKRITAAWQFLYEKTRTRKRSCGRPYYLHPMRVACLLAESRLDTDTIIAGFFHSILGLENITEQEVIEKFGEDICKIIRGTTKITNLHIKNTTLQQADSIRKMLFAMVDDVRIILVKLADRLDRMRNITSVEEKAQRAIAAEVIDIWAPLADRLGMQSVKSEMEDLSLKYANPAVFQQIKAIVAQKKGERAEYLDKAVQTIYKAAEKAGIEITITSRAKHFYSIYQKMRKRNKGADELFDLLALRIICNTETECYTLVGIVHGQWKPMDGRFKDYIAMPKANGYQSLHTTVICEGKPLEIQIRTRDMHNVAEHGVASHWLYKKGTNHDMVKVENLSIFNQLKELRTEHINDETFFNELKNDLLGDEIFVFTPKGDVVQLPAGSTAIDFAYHIHSAIGEKIVGAKADGKIIPLSTPLKNTQIIGILTNPQAHPTENQLTWVKTSKAKQKIKAWLTANDETFVDKNALAKAEAENAANTVYSQQKAAERKKRVRNGAPAAGRETGKIRIGNTTNFIVTLAKCCNPKFGDPIVGYVSRNRGLTVHRADCLTFQRIPNIENRTIEVMWDTEDDKNKDRKKH
ncbi:MAG: RelA/SpoT family protein [Treponema sp.]|jgi:GTP pyrophosphokinase|nr:RelA/SpoT family protein [Treponema sp.]